MAITPDSMSPTASATTAKSGYGIQQTVTANVSTTQSSAVTAAQMRDLFPGVQLRRILALLDRSVSANAPPSPSRIIPTAHITGRPISPPSGIPMELYAVHLAPGLLDAAGMLSMNLTDSIRIRATYGKTGISPPQINKLTMEVHLCVNITANA